MSNWRADDAYDKETVWCMEVCGDIQSLFCAEGASRYITAWGAWDDGDQEKIIGPITARDMLLRHASKRRRLGMFMLFFGDLYGHKSKINFMKEDDYVMKLLSTHGLLSLTTM